MKSRTHMAIAATAMTVAVVWRFWPWMPSVLFGDDLAYYIAHTNGDYPNTALKALFSQYTEKYRPVFAISVHWLFLFCDKNITGYLITNVLLHAVNSFIIWLIAYRLSRKEWLIALFLGLAASTSRFALYQVTQICGLTEGLATFFFLASIYFLVAADDSKTDVRRNCWCAIAAAFLTLNAHERYIVLLPWLCVAFLLIPSVQRLARSDRVLLALGCAAGVLFNVLYKKIVLKQAFFVGTGGTHIRLDIQQIFEHLRQGVLSMGGLNAGPEYLAGINYTSLNFFPSLPLAVIFFSSWLGGILFGTKAVIPVALPGPTPRWLAWRWPALLFLLGGLVLAPALLTIRLEQRWLVGTFTLGLLTSAWAMGTIAGSHSIWLARTLAFLLAISSIAIDTTIAPYFRRIFFVSSGQIAEAVKRDIVDPAPNRSNGIGLFLGADQCDWTLLKGEFFRVYGGTFRPIYRLGSSEGSNASQPSKDADIFGLASKQPFRFSNITNEWHAANERITVGLEFDFLAAYSSGTINNPVKMDTPSGQGAMRVSWDSGLIRRNSLTVVSGFQYRYDNIAVSEHSQLRFGIGMIFPAPEPARATVTVGNARSGMRVLYQQILTPPDSEAHRKFAPVLLPLREFAGETVTIIFSVDTPGRNGTAHWIGFADPRLVRNDNP